MFRVTNREMIEEYLQALSGLEKRHEQLTKQIRVYDKRIVLLEEEIDEIWEVIAALKKYEEGDRYGWHGNGVSAGGRRQGVSAVLGL